MVCRSHRDRHGREGRVLLGSGRETAHVDHHHVGRVPDPDFGPALLEIWLHPESRSDKLRRELTGGRR
jgi:hypothetical protein